MTVKKGENIEVIGITDLTVLTDYFVIATATSSTQVKAISDEVEYKLDLLGVEPHHIEGRNTSWVCLDYNSVVIHIFHKQQRDFYSLEQLVGRRRNFRYSKIIGGLNMEYNLRD